MDSPGSSIIIITLILAITVLLTVSIRLLLRHLNRRHLSTTSLVPVAPENPTGSSVAPSSSGGGSRSNNRTMAPVAPENPTASSVASSSSRSSSRSNCCICLSTYKPQEQRRSMPHCFHKFHHDCVNKWQALNNTCPVCRSTITVADSDVVGAIGASSGANGSSRL